MKLVRLLCFLSLMGLAEVHGLVKRRAKPRTSPLALDLEELGRQCRQHSWTLCNGEIKRLSHTSFTYLKYVNCLATLTSLNSDPTLTIDLKTNSTTSSHQCKKNRDAAREMYCEHFQNVSASVQGYLYGGPVTSGAEPLESMYTLANATSNNPSSTSTEKCLDGPISEARYGEFTAMDIAHLIEIWINSELRGRKKNCCRNLHLVSGKHKPSERLNCATVKDQWEKQLSKVARFMKLVEKLKWYSTEKKSCIRRPTCDVTTGDMECLRHFYPS